MRFTLALATLTTLCTFAGADQLSVTPSKDNTLYEEAIGALSNGIGTGFFVGRVGSGGGGTIRRGLLAFDVGSIPLGSTITAVTLKLNCAQTTSGNATVSLQRNLADWGEGTSDAGPTGGSGASSTPGDATWLHTFYPASFWSTVGEV